MKRLVLVGFICLTVQFLQCESAEERVSLQKIVLLSTHLEKVKAFRTLMQDAQECFSAQEVMDYAIDSLLVDGFYLEMGVFKASSINYIAGKLPHKIIHGFDSFKGLPENWTRADTSKFSKGFFALQKLPEVKYNVKLYPGWFQDSLPLFKNSVLFQEPIALLHIDCDLYSSTKTVFEQLQDNIVTGTVIVFDELYGYPGFENHELKAFAEFLELKNYSVRWLAYNSKHEQVAVQIV